MASDNDGHRRRAIIPPWSDHENEKDILVVGTLDTKGVEVGFLKEQIERRGHRTVVMDILTCNVQAGQPGKRDAI